MTTDVVNEHPGKPRRSRLLTIWTPEDKAFWEKEGEAMKRGPGVGGLECLP